MFLVAGWENPEARERFLQTGDAHRSTKSTLHNVQHCLSQLSVTHSPVTQGFTGVRAPPLRMLPCPQDCTLQVYLWVGRGAAPFFFSLCSHLVTSCAASSGHLVLSFQAEPLA